MDNGDKGVSSSELEKQIAGLEYYIGDIKENLDSFTGKIDRLSNSLDSDGMQALMASYSDNKNNYDSLYTNLSATCTKIIERMSEYHDKDQEIARDIG